MAGTSVTRGGAGATTHRPFLLRRRLPLSRAISSLPSFIIVLLPAVQGGGASWRLPLRRRVQRRKTVSHTPRRTSNREKKGLHSPLLRPTIVDDEEPRGR
nr:hypothetical protein Itr_chr02CG09130 [Ipomoea trifida]